MGQKALKVPEKLLFNVIWGGWGFRWITAGQATLELLPTASPTEWKIRSLAWNNGFFQSIYPVRDTVTSVIDSRGIYPIRFDKHLHEGSYHASISARYDQAAHILKTQDTSLTIEPFTHDVLSAFYFIRTQKIKPGDTLDLAAVSGKKKYNLKVLVPWPGEHYGTGRELPDSGRGAGPQRGWALQGQGQADHLGDGRRVAYPRPDAEQDPRGLHQGRISVEVLMRGGRVRMGIGPEFDTYYPKF